MEARYVKVVEDCIAFHFWPKLIHSEARCICDSWTTCFINKRLL